jgi:alpha-glucosidase (family GH31 glycosyl hydrolase)
LGCHDVKVQKVSSVRHRPSSHRIASSVPPSIFNNILIYFSKILYLSISVSMTLLLFIVLAITFIGPIDATPRWPELYEYDPIADPKATIVSGNARFTVLTDRVIRMEYINNGSQFLNNATTAILNRKLTVPKFTTSTSSAGVLTISTDSVTVAYTTGQPFSSNTLSASGTFGTWKYGQKNQGNLLGTIKSLDELGPTSLNCTENQKIIVHGEDLHCSWGLISRDGWAVINDQQTFAMDNDNWWTSNANNVEDLYLFAHGNDYKGALSDFVQLSGKVAMPPRAAFGLWWTRWFNYNAVDIRTIVDEYRDHHLPLGKIYLLS